MTLTKKKPQITIAGASGFIGRNLLATLEGHFIVNGLSRRDKRQEQNINWIQTDLFSFHSTKTALEDTDIAIYLVHSMLPSSRLFQGNFQDTDIFIADNFARACVQNNIKQIIYLGGLVPEKKLSEHLESRKEVEDLFMATGIPTTILRAGMVVGDGGSSFEILKNLVINLPVMVLPKWTTSSTQTIYIDDLVRVIKFVINNEQFYHKTVNVVNGENITYRDLIEKSSNYFQGTKFLFPVPINYTSFSKLWVKIFGNADYELVSPLIDSLLCNFSNSKVPSEISELIHYKAFSDMLLKIPKEKRKRLNFSKDKGSNTVRSIQRLSNANNIEVGRICDLYVGWLPKYLKNIIRVKLNEDRISFNMIGIKVPLLILQRQEGSEEIDRIKFHIVGGFLTKTNNTGWLEFRKVFGGGYTLASINEFVPSLPWYIYRYSQAIIHLRTMKSFSKFLSEYQNKN